MPASARTLESEKSSCTICCGQRRRSQIGPKPTWVSAPHTSAFGHMPIVAPLNLKVDRPLNVPPRERLHVDARKTNVLEPAVVHLAQISDVGSPTSVDPVADPGAPGDAP